jgi:hypothetical protein
VVDSNNEHGEGFLNSLVGHIFWNKNWEQEIGTGTDRVGGEKKRRRATGKEGSVKYLVKPTVSAIADQCRMKKEVSGRGRSGCGEW